jgi:hypothetical protein
MPRCGVLSARKGLLKSKDKKKKKKEQAEEEGGAASAEEPGTSASARAAEEEDEGIEQEAELEDVAEDEDEEDEEVAEIAKPNPWDQPGPWTPAVLQKGEKGYKYKTKFKQQRYKVRVTCWQNPKDMLLVGFVFGLTFLTFGSLAVEQSNGLHTVSVVYDCYGEGEACACDGQSSCTTTLEVPEGMSDGRLVLFYELEGFKQNHRRYKPSWTLEQLRYPMVKMPKGDDLEDCAPRMSNTSAYFYSPHISYGAIGTPCGLHTAFVFDDDVQLLKGGEPLGEEWAYGSWDGVLDKKFDSNDTRFVAWMRTSPFALRKPLLLFDEGLEAGTYDLSIANRYDSAIFRGNKKLVLAEMSGDLGGGRESNLAVGVIGVVTGTSVVLLTLLIFLLAMWKKSPLRKRRKLLEKMLEKADRDSASASINRFSVHEVPWARNSFIADADAPSDMDEAIRRGLDLIERYASSPTVEALESLMSERSARRGSTQLLSAARRMSAQPGAVGAPSKRASIKAMVKPESSALQPTDEEAQ